MRLKYFALLCAFIVTKSHSSPGNIVYSFCKRNLDVFRSFLILCPGVVTINCYRNEIWPYVKPLYICSTIKWADRI